MSEPSHIIIARSIFSLPSCRNRHRTSLAEKDITIFNFILLATRPFYKIKRFSFPFGEPKIRGFPALFLFIGKIIDFLIKMDFLRLSDVGRGHIEFDNKKLGAKHTNVM